MDTRVVYLEPGKIALETATLPELGANQVLVQTHQASVWTNTSGAAPCVRDTVPLSPCWE